MLLPEIARLFCVTIDELYREKTVAYENYAQRLASLYEYTRKPEDFLQAELEFRRMVKSGTYSMEDLRSYGVIHHYMMNYCKNKAMELFDRVLENPAEKDDFTYSKTKAQKIALCIQIGKGDEIIQEQYELAYEWFQKSIALFPEEWTILVWGGDICEKLGRYEEAFQYWDKALKLDQVYLDPLYSKAFCHEKLGEKEQASGIQLLVPDCRTVGQDCI